MRTEIIVRNIYTFAELSQEAKDKVCNNWEWDDNDSSMLTELFEEDLNNHYMFKGAKVYWSLSSCQGDGVSFTGEWFNDGCIQLLEKAYNGNIPKNLKRIIPWLVLEIRNINNRYCHKRSVTLDVDVDNYYLPNYPRIEKVIDDIRKTVEAYRLQVCDELEDFGYKEIDYHQTEEYIKEMCESNNYEFLEDGTML